MPRKDFVIKSFIAPGLDTSGFDLIVILRRDFATEQEIANAPGVILAHLIEEETTSRNEAIQRFTVTLDPLYDTREEARADFEKWLQERTVKLDGDVWNTDDPKE
jgi:hypothetical protein